MSGLAQKINMGVATAALVAAATLTPTAVANAESVGSLGSHVGSAQCVPSAAETCETLTTAGLTAAASTPGDAIRGVFQNQFWWIGQANPTPPPRSNVLVFTPISLVPGFLKPLYGWFTQNLNFEACLFGATMTVGPYGTTSFSVGRGCN